MRTSVKGRRGHEDPKAMELGRLELFAGCDEGALARIAGMADIVTVAPGARLTTEALTTRQCAVIMEGSASVDVGGREVAELGPGEVIGEMGLLTHDPSSATVTATSPLRIVVMAPSAFRVLYEDNPSVAQQIARSLTRRLRALDGLAAAT